MVRKLIAFFFAGVFLRWISIGCPNWVDFNVYWSEGDGIWTQAILQLLKEQNWIPFTGIYSARLSYPYGMDFGMFPVMDPLHWTAMHVLNLIFESPVLAFNLYYLISAGLICASMGWVCLSLGIPLPLALVAALSYSALPYALARIQHIFLVAYFQVPLIFYLALKIRENLKPGLLILLGVVTATTGIYYDFYSMLILCLVGLGNLILLGVKRNFLTMKLVLRNGILFGIPCLLFTAIGMASSWLYIYKNGDPRTTERHYSESIVFGLDAQNIFVPPTDHWLPIYREIKPLVYTDRALAEDHMIGAYGGYMGIPAIIGFFISVFYIFRFWLKAPSDKEYWLCALGIISLFCIAYGQKGGLGYLFSYYISPQIRANYRICIYIATASLLAFYLWIRPHFENIKGIKWKAIACTGLLIASLLDQGGVFYQLNPDHKNTNSDREFAKQMKEALGDKPMLKLPFGAFPEWSGYMSVEPYSPMRFIMAETIHSVFPAIKGTKSLEEQWPLFFGKIPTKPALISYGIAGVVIDTSDYPDGGQEAMNEYLSASSRYFYSPNKRFVFIDLRF